jgi:hypothetical protein
MSDGIGSVVNPATGNEGHSVETAAADFSAMLAEEGRHDRRPRREDDGKPARQSPAEADAAAPREAGQSRRQPPEGERGGGEESDDGRERDPILEAEGEEPEDKGSDDDEPDENDDENEGDEAEDDDEGEGEPDPFLDAKHKVTVNGEELEVSGREALAGYMKEADYRQGTERNAREYAEIEGFAQETVAMRHQAATAQQTALDLIAALQPDQEHWDAMKRENPQAYIQAQEHWNQILEKARGLAASRNQLAEDQSAEAIRAKNKWLENQDRELLTKFPALRDEKKANSFRAVVRDYAAKVGYSPEELAEGGGDHRSLITLYKAGMYDRLLANQKAAGRKAQGNTPKPSAEGRARSPGRSPNRNAARNADRRLAQRGDLQSAADSFAAMIRAE